MKQILVLLFWSSCFLVGLQAQQFSTSNVYDFAVGDEFHYRANASLSGNSYDTMRIERILTRTSTSNHLIYEVGIISPMDSSIWWTRFDSIPNSTLNSLVVDTSNVATGNSGDTVCNVTVDSSMDCSGFIFLNANCNEDFPSNLEPAGWNQHFALGRGEIFYSLSVQNGFKTVRQVYFKKGNQSCGTPAYTSIRKPLAEALNTYPNPIDKTVYIDIPKAASLPLQMEIYDQLGCLVMQHPIQQSGQAIPVQLPQALASGIYYLRLSNAQVTYQAVSIFKK